MKGFVVGMRNRRRPRWLTITVSAALAAAVFVGVASAGLDSPFATATSGCGPDFLTRADFGSFPVSRELGSVLARISTSVGVPRIDAYTGDGESASIVTGGADTTWLIMPKMPAGFDNSIVAYGCQGSVAAELYEVPTVPATFSGALTHGAQANAAAELSAHVERGGHLYADLVLQQGSVALSKEPSGASQKFASPGRFDLGTLRAGSNAGVYVTALDGPQTKWQVTIARSPADVSAMSVTPKIARPGAPLRISYSLAGDARVTANVVSADGSAVRSLGMDFAATTGPHSVTWDGLSQSGQPVGDGTYTVKIATDESTSGESSLMIDGTPPVVRLLSPLRLRPRRACVVRISDKTSGVRSASMKVDGRTVRRLLPGTSSLLYRPAGGWGTGQHSLSVVALDQVGNRTHVALRIRVA